MDKGESSYRRYLDGDDEGIVELIRDYKDGLTLYINGITGNMTLAEDIMEETFFRLAAKKPPFRGKSSFKTWLYSIGRNAAVDVLRNRSRYSDIPVEEYTDIADDTDIERAYIREEQRIMLHRAMSRLNPDYRQVLYLTFFEDFTVNEAALVMKKNVKQINNLLYRAKNALKNELEKGGFEYERL